MENYDCIEAIVTAYQSGDCQIKCPVTRKDVAAVNLYAKPGQQSMYCVNCLISSNTKDKKDLLSLDDLWEVISIILQTKRKAEEYIDETTANAQLSKSVDNLRSALVKQIDQTVVSQLPEITKSLREYIHEQVFGMQTSSAPQKQEAIALAKLCKPGDTEAMPSDLAKAVKFYLENRFDKKLLLRDSLKDTSAGYILSERDKEKVTALVKSMMKAVVNKITADNLMTKLFTGDTDLIHRSLNLAGMYDYGVGGNLSLSFRVNQHATLFGFSNYHGSQAFRVRYTISIGERKDPNNIVHEWESNLRTLQDLVRVAERQTQASSAEMLDVPLSLEPETWYNVSMVCIEGGQRLMMNWGNGQGGGNTQMITGHEGVQVTFKVGTDDTSGNGTYAHIYPDFFTS